MRSIFPSYRLDRKLYMSFRLVHVWPWMTLNDLERRNGSYFALFKLILPNLVLFGTHCVKVVDTQP